MKSYWFTLPVKIMGLVTAVHELAISASPNPTVLMLSAAMMVGGQTVDMALEQTDEPSIEKQKPKQSLHAPSDSYVVGVYKKYKIFDLSPDAPFVNWTRFAIDITDALLADEPSLRLEAASDGVYTNDQWMSLTDHERQWALQEQNVTVLPVPETPSPMRPKPDPMTQIAWLLPGERILQRALRRYNRP
jgi:hypothetical protein